jgi:hypothetical protein
MAESDPDILICHRCKRTLSAEDIRRVHPFFRIPAALALGPFHAGMWMWQELSLPYCARCRRVLSFLCALLAITVLTLAWLAFRWAYVAFDIK